MKLNIKKRLAAMLTAGTLSLTLAGCDKTKDDKSSTDTTTIVTTTTTTSDSTSDTTTLSGETTITPTESIVSEPIVETDTTTGKIYGGKDINDDYYFMVELSFKFDENGFMIGDYKSILDTLEKYPDVPIGIVIKPKDYSLADIYLALDEIKKFIKQFPTSFPIFYDMDSLLEQEQYKNDKYVEENNYIMMKSFLEKGDYNGMFVGIAGKESTFKKYKKYFSNDNSENLYSTTDKLLYGPQTDGDKYNMYKIGESYKSTLKDYKTVIERNNFNSPSNFKDDYYYIVDENDTMEDIQQKFNVKNIDNLYRYNYNFFVYGRKLYKGQVLRIPTVLEENNRKNVETNDLVDPYLRYTNQTYVKGIDISSFNSIDWNAASNIDKLDFTVLKLANTYFTIDLDKPNSIDKSFESYYNNVKEKGIPTTFYIYCQWHEPNENESHDQYIKKIKDNARKEAEWFVNYIEENNYEPDLGVLFFDYEGAGSDGRFQTQKCTSEYINAIMSVHKEVVEAAGYKYGIYTNCATGKKMDFSKFKDSIFWIAGGPFYGKNRTKEFYTLDELNGVTDLSINLRYTFDPEESGIAIQQITSSGRLSCAGNSSLDVNLMDKKWLEYLIEYKKNMDSKKKNLLN